MQLIYLVLMNLNSILRHPQRIKPTPTEDKKLKLKKVK